ncbi:LysR family transcriptional regulator [Marinivivus vitaminiproducens]|uniref:LysR family transcriptional regulator n=1 Tax=Marinivivus vitaminiproducens TaxID=3035935 RepID=UPI0027A4CF72|nr:LysR family transcriptional regulator [Geminicoccaceae bacterium SCSIO 64248]
MPRAGLTELTAFAAIARLRSFRQAADELALAPSTLSHMMRVLEQRLGVRLLNRTTRSVALTEAGERLLLRLGPALDDLYRALDEVEDFRDRPGGTLRINAALIPARLMLHAVIPKFRRLHPEVHVDLATDGRLVDIVQDGFDAGVRLGETVPQDMIGIGFGGDARCLVVGSPAYFAERPKPETPDDLTAHACIRHRMPSGKLFRWEFERHGQEMAVDVGGPITLDQLDLMVEAALGGVGLAYVFESMVREHLADGRLVAVLEDWCPPFPGLYLYYPGRRHVPAALRAFIDVIKSADIG